MLTPNEVADVLHVTDRTVRNWCAAGRRPGGHGIWAERINRDWLIAATICWCGRVVFLGPTSKLGHWSAMCVCGTECRAEVSPRRFGAHL
jgi:hypothetical protein